MLISSLHFKLRSTRNRNNNAISGLDVFAISKNNHHKYWKEVLRVYNPKSKAMCGTIYT